MNAPQPLPRSPDALNEGDELSEGQFLHSKNNLYHLTIQSNGRLVAYQGPQATVTSLFFWSPGLADRPGSKLRIRGGGNLELYHGNDILWTSNTSMRGATPSRLVLQDDRNLALIDHRQKTFWTSNTATSTATQMPVNSMNNAPSSVPLPPAASSSVPASMSQTQSSNQPKLPALQTGTFGRTVLVRQEGNKIVAVKSLPLLPASRPAFKALLEALQSANSSNILPIISWKLDEELGGRTRISWGYCQRGNLAQYLKSISKSSSSFIPAMYIELMKGIAQGLQYLHESKPSRPHRNLKPENILIADTTFFPMLADLVDEETVRFTCESGTLPYFTRHYFAPEVLEGKASTDKSDIFALGLLGIVVANLDATIIPRKFTGMGTTVPGLLKEADLFALFYEATSMLLPDYAELRRLLGRCLQRLPAERPPIGGFLRGLKPALPEPAPAMGMNARPSYGPAFGSPSNPSFMVYGAGRGNMPYVDFTSRQGTPSSNPYNTQ